MRKHKEVNEMRKYRLMTLIAVASLIVLSGCSFVSNSPSSPLMPSNPSEPSAPSTNEKPSGMIGIDELGGYIANISDAKALGIGKPSTKSRIRKAKSDDGDYENVTTFVKSSTDAYDPNDPVIGANGLEEVTFTKTNTTVNGKIIDGQKTYIAKADQVNPEVVSFDKTSITIKADSDHEYRIVADSGEVYADWTKAEDGKDTLTFENLQTTEYTKIKARCINSTITFEALDGFTYTLKDVDGNILKENVTDNGKNDSNQEKGVITFNGLLENQKFTVSYHGEGEETVVTQEKVNGFIDKLYTLGDFTFVSYVTPNIASNKGIAKDKYGWDDAKDAYGKPLYISRPGNDKLDFDENGVSFYDKVNYYSDSEHQSYIINNATGLVYKLDDFRIDKIENGLFWQGNFVYDMSIQNGNAVFTPLFSNPDINAYSVIKDRYGKKYIYNDKIEQYDSGSNTVFYTDKPESGSKPYKYLINSQGEVLKYYIKNIGYRTSYEDNPDELFDLKIMTSEGERELNQFDNYYFPKMITKTTNWGNFSYLPAITIRNGIFYEYASDAMWSYKDNSLQSTPINGFLRTIPVYAGGVDEGAALRFGGVFSNQKEVRQIVFGSSSVAKSGFWTEDSLLYCNYNYLINYDLLLLYVPNTNGSYMNGKYDKKVLALKNFSSISKYFADEYHVKFQEGSPSWNRNYESGYWTNHGRYNYFYKYTDNYKDSGEEIFGSIRTIALAFPYIISQLNIDIILDNVDLVEDSNWYYNLSRYEIDGTKNYELIADKDENGNVTVTAYEEGVYHEPVREVVLQPVK